MQRDSLDDFLAFALEVCPCDACERYRNCFAAKVAEYSHALRRSLGLDNPNEDE